MSARARRGSTLLAAALLASCGPTLLWHGHDPARAHRALVEEQDDLHRVVIDGEPHRRFDAVAFAHLRWSERGAVYPAMHEGRWFVVVDGVPGAPHDAIGELVVEGSRVAYSAQDPDGWRVFVDGVAGPRFDSLTPRSLSLGASRGPVVYAGRDGGGAHVVVGGAVGPRFEDVSQLRLAAKSRVVAYVGWTATSAQIVVSGERHGHFDEVHELRLAASGRAWAAVVTQGGERRVLWQGRALLAPPDTHDLVIADDGSHIAWVGGGSVSLDGRPVAAAAEVGSIALVPRTGALLYVRREAAGERVVVDGRPGPRVRRVAELAVSAAGHWGYVAERGIGRAVVIDGEPVYRGEWAGSLRLAARADAHAFLVRRAGQRRVVTASAEHPVPRPLVDTLELSDDGASWGLLVADESAHALRVLVDGRAAAELDTDEVAASMMSSSPSALAAVRRIVRGVLRAEASRAR